ncbi:cupin domain-containing protein [Naasia sp. SYSU D00948]|uniref:cupin domain-containing protein n=1 Tax=Naasia sp. SYSU D00948 TaxID=2817379 RepID=UPI001B3059EB|nr:cupin domain-containing protein [Naasia sp. SYSU D00948]
MKKQGLIWKSSIGIAAAVAVAIGTVTVATATPGSGTSPGPAVIGELEEGKKAKADGIELKTQGDVTVLDFELTYAVGGYSGWHEHPGIVIATVKSGTVTRQLDCGPAETFTVGDTFIEVGPHFISNPGSEPAVLSITQLVPSPERDARRIDLPAPVC